LDIEWFDQEIVDPCPQGLNRSIDSGMSSDDNNLGPGAWIKFIDKVKSATVREYQIYE
jgi:hypothetical protein